MVLLRTVLAAGNGSASQGVFNCVGGGAGFLSRWEALVKVTAGARAVYSCAGMVWYSVFPLFYLSLERTSLSLPDPSAMVQGWVM